MQVMCSGCKQPIELDPPSAPQIMNLPTVSMIVVEHAEQGFCPNCNTAVTAQITGLGGMLLVAAPVPPAAQKRLIVVPGRTQ
jgi:hypothetical protein